MTNLINRFLFAWLGALVATGCSAAPAKQPATSGGAPERAERDAGPRATGKTLLEGKPLVRGGESLPVFLDDRKLLHVGSRTIEVDHADPDAFAYHWKSQASLAVVDLDRGLDGRRAAVLLLTTPIAESEDPPNRYQIFVYEDAGLRRVFDRVPGAYGITPLEIPGDGTVRYVEDGWTACERTGHPTVATRQEVIFRLDASGTEMVEGDRKDTAETMKCDELAACPFVYVVGDDGEPRFAGEILRDLRGRGAYGLQGLAILAPAIGTLRLRISEEKAETTFLDELYVEAGGVRVRPVACEGSAPPAYCRADRRPQVMRQGDVLAIEVRMPPGAPSSGTVEVFARGYYIPTPTAHLR
jgi:hypothetical protein